MTSNDCPENQSSDYEQIPKFPMLNNLTLAMLMNKTVASLRLINRLQCRFMQTISAQVSACICNKVWMIKTRQLMITGTSKQQTQEYNAHYRIKGIIVGLSQQN